MTQDGYVAVIEYDPDLDTFAGRVVNLSSPVTFYGRTPEELRKEFMASVRTYLDICRERGIEPEKPYSGRFNVRQARNCTARPPSPLHCREKVSTSL